MMRSFIFLAFLVISTAHAADEAKIVVVRDAQSENHLMHTRNSNPRHSSYKPSYLTTRGKTDISQTAKSLKNAGITHETVSLTLVSPLPRALQTASALADQGVLPRDSIMVDTRLTAVQHGTREGEMYDLNVKTHAQGRDFEGETEEDVLVRVKRVLKDIGSQKPQGHVIVITHGTPATEIHRLLTGHEKRFQTAEAVVLPLGKSRFLTYE